VKQRMIEWLGPIVEEYYAATEGGGTYVRAKEWLERPGTVGRAGLGQEVRVRDEFGNDAPAGQVGMVWLRRSADEPFEYHRDPDKTRDVYDGEFFTLGDMGWMDEDGYLFLSGRSAELIISGGVNIYPAEIEGRLIEHPAVADVGVIGVPNEEWGEEVKAVVQVQDGASASSELAEELIAHCRAGLARYKVPRSVEFRDQLPRTDAGKLLKRQLRDEYWAATGREL